MPNQDGKPLQQWDISHRLYVRQIDYQQDWLHYGTNNPDSDNSNEATSPHTQLVLSAENVITAVLKRCSIKNGDALIVLDQVRLCAK
jgi:hypothetical protein